MLIIIILGLFTHRFRFCANNRRVVFIQYKQQIVVYDELNTVPQYGTLTAPRTIGYQTHALKLSLQSA